MSTETSQSNLITIIGRGVPANYEICVDGALEMIDGDPLEEATVVSTQIAEGAIETGVQRFHFSGQVTNVHLIDWNGVPAPESSSTPHVHIDYGATKRDRSEF